MGSNSVCFGQQIRVSVPSSLVKSYPFHPAWNVSFQSLETRSRYSTRRKKSTPCLARTGYFPHRTLRIRSSLFWQKSVETKIREFLKEKRLHIPRPHTITELREAVCGKDASKLKHTVFLQDFDKNDEDRKTILSVLNQWRSCS